MKTPLGVLSKILLPLALAALMAVCLQSPVHAQDYVTIYNDTLWNYGVPGFYSDVTLGVDACNDYQSEEEDDDCGYEPGADVEIPGVMAPAYGDCWCDTVPATPYYGYTDSSDYTADCASQEDQGCLSINVVVNWTLWSPYVSDVELCSGTPNCDGQGAELTLDDSKWGDPVIQTFSMDNWDPYGN